MAWRNDQVSELETQKIIEIARECLALPGDFVEMGCYKGDTSLLLAEVIRDYNRGGACGKLVEKSVDKPVENYVKNGFGRLEEEFFAKRLWIYDSFEGLPEKNSADESVLGADFKGGELYVTKREVKERFLRAGLLVPVIKKAWFSELTEKDLPERIAFAFLDGDFYESIRDSLLLVTPKMVGWNRGNDDGVVKNTRTGVIVVHDYNNLALPGVKKAVDEWAKREKVKTEVIQSMIRVWR